MKLMIMLAIMISLQISNANDLVISMIQKDKAIVKYMAFIGGGGTVFYISPTELIGAKHVCEMPGHLENGQQIIKKVLSKITDLCYLKVKYPVDYYLTLRKEQFKYQGSFCVSGFESLKYFRVSCAKLSQGFFMEDEYGKYLLLGGRAAVVGGMSGGPVIQSGLVIGVLTVRDEINNLGFFIDIGQINTFVGKARSK